MFKFLFTFAFENNLSQYFYNIVGHKWQVKKYNTGRTFMVVVTLRQVDSNLFKNLWGTIV